MLDDGGIHAIVNAYGADILSHEQMQIERDSLQHGAVTTYEHSIAVACLSVKIADRLHLWHHVNLRSLVRAALLHDYFLYDWHEKDNGSHRLRADFELDDIVSNSIRTHMFPLTPIPPKYLEGVIVNIADTLCAIRETLSPSRFHAAKP